jgi:Fe-S-cluster containining protein
MNFDFTKYFKEYEKIVAMSDNAFDRVKKEYPDYVKCKIKCSDCCHALFDLTLIEALYINHHFNIKFQGTQQREDLLKKADNADRKTYMLKKKAYKESESGKDTSEILAGLSLERVECPMLDNEEKCYIYDHRPITCRVYGIPTSIYERGHTCGRSGFKQGDSYPTIKLDIIQKKLYEISANLVADLNTKHTSMADILVPLSMAILTDYTEQYLGIETNKKQGADS